MAIVIKTNPGTYYSAHGDLLFVVYEATKAIDPVTYPDYKYVADVYIGATLVTRIKKVPQPDSKMGIFSIGNVIRNYVSSIFNPVPAVLRAQQMGLNEFNIAATVKFGEEYSFTLTTNLTVDSARTYYNHYNGRLIGQNTSLTDYLDKALTVRPYATPVFIGADFCFVPFLPTDTDNVTLSIKSYTGAGVLINTITQAYAPAAGNTLQLFNIAPGVLNTVTPGFINDAVKYYTVEFQTPNIAPDSIYKFIPVCEARYEIFTLHFLNRFGGFESRDFTKVSRKTIEIEKHDYGKLPYTVDSSGIVHYYNSNKVYNETRSNYASQYKEKMTLNTDILTDLEYQWLGDLVVSPLVYIEFYGYFIPLVITQTNYEFKKVINDNLTNLTIDIEFGDQLNAQYR